MYRVPNTVQKIQALNKNLAFLAQHGVPVLSQGPVAANQARNLATER